MNAYICVTYAQSDRQETDLFCRGLTRYGFRFSCINELGDPTRRAELVEGASLLIALTSPAAVEAEAVASDIRRALEQRIEVICVSLEGNELDHRFCTGMESGAALIPSPTEDTPDRHAMALFVHRLYVRHLARLSECFVEARCDDNVYGQLIRCAYYAHMGDGDACFELGRAYELGLGVPALEKEAAHWMTLAAEQDICDALVRLGQMRLLGIGVERDAEEAFRLFSRAADQGNIRGVYQRGLCYLQGYGVMRDPIHAVECLHAAARLQYTPALYNLAMLYRDGIGVERDSHTALQYLATVCRTPLSEDEEAPAWVASLDVYGLASEGCYTCVSMRQMRRVRLARAEDAFRGGSVDRRFARNRITAVDLPEDRWEETLTDLYDAPATDKGTSRRYDIYEADWTAGQAADAAYELGQLLSVGSEDEGLRPSPTRALVWYRYAARLGHAEALYCLGDAYRRGYGIPPCPERATQLFRMAADHGSNRGRFAYAVCCERGIGTQVDPISAARRYEQAADAGYAPAQNNLGGCYEYGIGVPQNMLTAVEWYTAAANAGLPEGQCRLGICYETGRSVAKDVDKAVRLYEQAAEQGYAYAQYRLALCYDRGIRGDVDGADMQLAEAFSDAGAGDAGTVIPSDGEDEVDPVHFTADHARAAALYQQAADGGVPEAAYALYLCHRWERGGSRDERVEIFNLRRAAEADCLQACYELGMSYLEGRGLSRDPRAAVACFLRAVELWNIYAEDAGRLAFAAERETLPPDALSLRQAAGDAMYMLGYCTLYGIGQGSGMRDRAPTAPSTQQIDEAVPYFREAADIEHVGAMTMLGDLYAYGLLIPETATASDEALGFYMEAARVSEKLDSKGGRETDGSVNALMDLAKESLRVAAGETDVGNAELAWVNAWRSLADSAARGSADALVDMAECAYAGHGTPRNPAASERLLRRAETLHGGRVQAALWLGDFLRSQWGLQTDPEEADRVYLRGLVCPYVESECGPYTLQERRLERREADVRARAEILYRLATLRAMYFSDEAKRREAFRYLAEAILMGHEQARDDLARMFVYEMNRPRGAARKATREQRAKENRFGAKARLRRRVRESSATLNRNNRALRIHREWVTEYYTALWPEPVPFAYGMKPSAMTTDSPAYVRAAVTDTMRVNALQYLGECYFEGYGLPFDAAAAVTCYRAVLAVAPKDTPQPPAAVVEATYSLGWCLLYGVGTAVNQPEAIRLLTRASRTHAGACYTLGVCHEEGRGVVVADDREAVKYYRKAHKLGHPDAAAKVETLEKRLQSKAEAM